MLTNRFIGVAPPEPAKADAIQATHRTPSPAATERLNLPDRVPERAFEP